jgi:hypothetical protein
MAVIKIEDRTKAQIRTLSDALDMTQAGYLRQLLERENKEYLRQKQKAKAQS